MTLWEESRTINTFREGTDPNAPAVLSITSRYGSHGLLVLI